MWGGAPRLRPRRPYVCVGCVGGAGLRLLRGAWVDSVCGFWAGLGVLWCWLGAGFGVAVACVVIRCLRSYACWAGLGVLWCWLSCGCGLCRDSVPTFLRVLAWLGLCGGNCYHRRCVAACRRRVGGLWSQNPRVVARLRGCVPVWWLGFAVVSGGVVSGGMSLVSLWLGSSLLVAWGELLP